MNEISFTFEQSTSSSFDLSFQTSLALKPTPSFLNILHIVPFIISPVLTPISFCLPFRFSSYYVTPSLNLHILHVGPSPTIYYMRYFVPFILSLHIQCVSMNYGVWRVGIKSYMKVRGNTFYVNCRYFLHCRQQCTWPPQQ